MKLYLAAPYQSRDIIRKYADQLVRIGFTVTSTWLEEQHEINDGTTGAATALPDGQVAQHAADDFKDIDASDLMVLFTESAVGHKGGGGRHVETGYAIARDLNVIVVGEPENVFHRMGGPVQVVPHWHEAVIELAALLVTRERHSVRNADQAVMGR